MDQAAIYCRLSKEDRERAEQEDSESIQNQRLLLINYALEHNMQIFKVYSDDDFSGADKNRPDWNRMLKDAKDGKFNVILCKTQSRFTRDMEVVEKYIHGLFAEWSIRFIGVVDHTDTDMKGNKKARQIYGLVNEWYLEDVSENIKSVFRQKMKDGKFLGSFACYGYKKDPEDKYRLLPDEEAAETVRRIFRMYLQGYGTKQIAVLLTEEKLLTPTLYKQASGLSYNNSQAGALSARYGIWGVSTVKRILCNKTYIGHLIQGREKKVSYKSKKVILAPEDEWIIVRNNHEPIIEPEVFEQVQKLLRSRRTVSRNNDVILRAHCLAAKVRCMDCGSSMVKAGGSSTGKSYLRCRLAGNTDKVKCTPHSIRLDRLIDEVSVQVHNMAEELLFDAGNRLAVIKLINAADSIRKKSSMKIRNENHIENRLGEIKNAVSLLYIDRGKGTVSEETFARLIKKFEEDIRNYEGELENLKKDTDKVNERQGVPESIPVQAADLLPGTLTGYVVNELIDYIEIGERNTEGVRDINIHWRL